MSEKATNEAVKSALKDQKNVKVTILNGDAPEQYNPKSVNIAGTISAPRRFVENRLDTFDSKKSHCLVSKTDGEITLVVNEHKHCGNHKIVGKVSLGKKFLELGINTDKVYDPKELANKLRLMRSIFKTHSDHARITSALRNIEATVNGQMKDLDDRKGNRTIAYEQTVESNIPDTFTLDLPLIEGEESEEIEVQSVLEVSQGSIVCYLESIDGQDRIEDLRTELVENEIELIESETTVIYY